MRVVDAESEEEAAGAEGEGGEGGVPSWEGSHFGDDEYIEWPEVGYTVTTTAVGVSDAGGSDEEDSNQSDDLMPGSDIEDDHVLRDLWGNESEDSHIVYVDESDTDSDDSEISSGSEISGEDESESDDSEISNEDGALLGGLADIEEHITVTFMVHEPEELRMSRIRRGARGCTRARRRTVPLRISSKRSQASRTEELWHGRPVRQAKRAGAAACAMMRHALHMV